MNVRKFRLLRRRSWLGKLLRLPFRLIPASTVIPVLFGHLRGKKWIKGSHNLSVLLGTYEKRQTNEFFNLAKESDIFWDLGAHVGYYSLLYHSANPNGKSFAFEPLPLNADYQRRHMELNGITGHKLFMVAVSNSEGSLYFNVARTSVAGKLAADGTLSVEVVRLSSWMADNKIPIPQIIKMDVEGEELKVLQDLEPMLRLKYPHIFLSTHGAEVHNSCIQFLQSLNYTLVPLDASTIKECRELLARRI